MALKTNTRLYPRPFNVNRVPGKPKRRKKITLVFDEDKRRDFLGGFHKRKVQRQKKAQEELQQKLKEEKKRIKQETKERFKKLLSSRDVPEVQELLSQSEYQMEGHTVSILEMSVSDLGGKSLIGENKVEYEEADSENKVDDEPSDVEEEIPGMELEERSVTPKEQNLPTGKKIESKKALKREMKKVTLTQMKKSKVFKQKQKLQRKKDVKENKRKQMKDKKGKVSGKMKKKHKQ